MERPCSVQRPRPVQGLCGAGCLNFACNGTAVGCVQEATRQRVVDPTQVAVGGHSYGAFMAANLLAHAPDLFACGIAKSGAYNRTLTPFGFQSEERTIWQAPHVYNKMSPFMQARHYTKLWHRCYSTLVTPFYYVHQHVGAFTQL